MRATGRTRRPPAPFDNYRISYYPPRELGAPVRILLRGRTRGGSGSGAKCSKARSYIASSSLAEIITPDLKVRHRDVPQLPRYQVLEATILLTSFLRYYSIVIFLCLIVQTVDNTNKKSQPFIYKRNVQHSNKCIFPTSSCKCKKE